MKISACSIWLPVAVALLVLPPAASAVVGMDWVTVVGSGNACDAQTEGCFGSVAAPYRISKYEVTNIQYADFLNAVAVTDTHGLYKTGMGSGFGGITQSGSSGSYSYALIDGRGELPVDCVSFWDATRFANWLHNGQPTGAQDDTTTEDGAYTLTPINIITNTVARNPGAAVFVTSEDEWYKAAYYDTGAMIYFDYPAGTDAEIVCTVPGATANTANCGPYNGDLTNVGSYTGAASPNFTFDQGGNVFEWNEAIVDASQRSLRGGRNGNSPGILAASFRISLEPSYYGDGVGFRLATPALAPDVPSLSPLAMTMLWSLLGLVGWRRLRA
ncbi:MAG: SUMF1/EgtB/PvdO family nonheme iron enzyme [Deltaproteobacteria bacterium]|nr:SUMF1/EgtB/PvdO family nonheme iron enzyme [Deltaproteobacteria bacterium]